ncbi:uncharacterized protein LOC124163486 isoform X2 [Ischnura elegans]|uniref:uncharacterized protein LOC124163486 isoform X2 n=1 Tax=Ischnura elegans TaxID=197161 RepID=UPI001ED8B93D|nr:uncharacterized protein LOC124163486 isoform X2 [Ischnura elegans]
MDPMHIKDIYCRICGIKSKKSVKIFSRKGRGMGLESKILKCLMLSVKRSDQLPTRVCFPCIDRLDDYSQFILHVKQAQVKLRVMLKSQGVHVKEERSNEAASERGRKRKRKAVEKVHDLPDSSSSDSVSDDSPSDIGDASDGDPPCKKAALSNQKTTVMKIPVKNEATDVSGTSGNIQVEQQNSADDSNHSKSNPSNLNSDAINMCSSNSLPCASSNVSSKVSEMQEDEISTSQEPVSLAGGSSNPVPHSTPSTTSDINVTISPPLFFPAQMPNPMIVLPGTSNPSGGGMVPFYIWSMPKGGVSNEVSKTSLPSVAIGKCNKPTSLEKQKVPCDVLSSRSFLSKPAVETISNGKMIVVLHSDNANSLPAPVSSQTPSVTVNSDNSDISNVCTEMSNMSQESQSKKSNLKETTVETGGLAVNKSLDLPNQGIEISPQISNCNEQPKNKSIPGTNSERTVQPSNTCLMLEESSQLSDLEGIRVQVSPVKVDKRIHLVGNGSANLPSSQEGCGINRNGSSNAHMPVLLSNEDVSRIPKDSQDVVPSKVSHEVSGTQIINKMCANSADLGSTHEPSSKEPKVVPGNINSVVLQDTSTVNDSEDSVEVESACAAASVVAEAVASDLTAVSCTQGSNNTDLSHSSGSSVSSKSSGKEKEIEVYDLCDIPPLIPISESVMKDVSDVECVESLASTSSPTITLENDLEEELEALVVERVPKSDSKKAGMEVAISCVSKNSKQSKVSKNSSSNAKKRKDSTVSNSGSSNNSATTAHKSSEWLVTESIGVNFTVDTDYSVVKCCLCSTDTYPFLITLASASDHCKFIHSQGTGSFGCIKCDFTSDEQLQIPQQLEALHQHIVSGCPPPEAPDSGAPQETTENGLDVTQVKMEPVDVYETALKNLKNSLQKVNMPRFRKLLTTFAPSSSNTTEVPPCKVKEEAEGSSKEVEIMVMDRSRNKLFIRKGSAYICRICSKKTYSKHQVKNHIGWHKPSERERVHIADFRQSVALSSGKECDEMIFDIPAIKVEKDDSPQAMDTNSVVDASSCLSDSPCNTSVALLTGNPSTPKMSPKKASKSVGRTSGTSEKGASKNEAVHGNQSHPSASKPSVKVPFIKKEPSMLSSTDKVTHKTSTNSFSFTVIPKRSLDESDVSYVNPSRNFRSKPIVKPLYKSPTATKDSSSSVVSPLASSGGFSPGSHLKVEKPSPVKPVVEEKLLPCKSKISFKIVKPGSDPHTSFPSKSKKSVGEGGSKDTDAPLTKILVRKNLNAMGVIRPSVSIGSGNGKETEQSSPLIKRPSSNSVPVQALSSPIKSKMEHPGVTSSKKSVNESVTVNSPKKIVTESMTVNGLVLKVPFIKLQRLNLLNIDPRTGFVNNSAACSGSEENVNKEGSEDTGIGKVVNQSENTGERLQKPSTS